MEIVLKTNTMYSQSEDCDRKTFQIMISTLLLRTLGSVASLLSATLYQGNLVRKHKPWKIIQSERYTSYADDSGMSLHVSGKCIVGFNECFRMIGSSCPTTSARRVTAKRH